VFLSEGAREALLEKLGASKLPQRGLGAQFPRSSRVICADRANKDPHLSDPPFKDGTPRALDRELRLCATRTRALAHARARLRARREC
jgi:hypothetical protein